MNLENLIFRKVNSEDSGKIWELLQQGIERRRKDGSNQWQDGYPNPETVKNDIENNFGCVLVFENEVIAYAALIFNNEPAYETIDGKWLTNGDFLVIHRMVVDEAFLGKGIAKSFFIKIEDFAKENNVFSIKVDTNFDNAPMLKILKNLQYTYCGEVHFRGSPRKAFEKVLQTFRSNF